MKYSKRKLSQCILALTVFVQLKTFLILICFPPLAKSVCTICYIYWHINFKLHWNVNNNIFNAPRKILSLIQYLQNQIWNYGKIDGIFLTNSNNLRKLKFLGFYLYTLVQVILHAFFVELGFIPKTMFPLKGNEVEAWVSDSHGLKETIHEVMTLEKCLLHNVQTRNHF